MASAQQQSIAHISERVSHLASIGQGEALLIQLLTGPIKSYFTRAESFNASTLTAEIEEDLQRLRGQYKQTAKFLTGAFQDLISLTNALQGMPKQEQLTTLTEMGVNENTKYVYDTIRSLHKAKGGHESQKLENLLKQVHYSQLINLDYKFAITTADSLCANSGKCMILLKLELLNQRNEKESVFTELTLDQFYTLFHELKRANSLMSMV